MNADEPKTAIVEYLESNNIKDFIAILDRAPEAIGATDYAGRSLLLTAARRGNKEICIELLRRGVSPNAQWGAFTAISDAAEYGHTETLRVLLEAGGNPNLGRLAFTLVRNRSGKTQEYVPLLVKHGFDLNRLYAMFGDAEHPISALDFAGTGPFSEVLRKAGAKTAKEILAENPYTEIDGANDKP